MYNINDIQFQDLQQLLIHVLSKICDRSHPSDIFTDVAVQIPTDKKTNEIDEASYNNRLFSHIVIIIILVNKK